jgi:hypothetical protein
LNTAETQERALVEGQAADDVAGCPKGHEPILFLRGGSHQHVTVTVCLAGQTKCFQLTLLDETGGVGLHACGHGEGEQGVRVLGAGRELGFGNLSGLRNGGSESAHAARVGLTADSAEQGVVVEEELSGEDSVTFELLEDVGGG